MNTSISTAFKNSWKYKDSLQIQEIFNFMKDNNEIMLKIINCITLHQFYVCAMPIVITIQRADNSSYQGFASVLNFETSTI